MSCIEVATGDLFLECFQTKEGREYLHPREAPKLPGFTHLSHTSSHLSPEGIVTAIGQTRKEAPGTQSPSQGRELAFLCQVFMQTELWLYCLTQL